ncbi:MAG: Gfo/Idh/MocA family oxidoreductase [Gemmatimonadetes bacterium]|jgi:predicted dehydrogenase|nr:Gfo/Idh/MocA family oxidoreductase [Gemmatimonadota bacterium]
MPPLKAVAVGLGHRTEVYSSYSLKHPDELQIVGAADPDPGRLQRFAEKFDVPANACFATSAELAAQPRFADVALNGTMDRQHVPTTLPLLEAGYDTLLEKPICPDRGELLQLLETSRRTDCKVMICHVLRYAPFYVEVRRRVADGEIGDLISIRTVENVSYHHMAVGFVRGKWSRTADSNPMLLAKCCHDMDVVSWMHSGVRPLRVSSFGNLMYFRPENAPEGSGKRCLVDCRIEETCPYSARRNYIDQGRWGFYAWDSLEHIPNPTVEQKLESLRTDNPYGRCVWQCDNDVVDHQSVIVEFEDGCVAAHDMVGNTARPCRTIHLVGTDGEIEGNMEEGKFVVRKPDARAGHEYSEEAVDMNLTGDMHGGGDLRLVGDFLRVVRGEKPSLSTTDLMDSVNGHMIAFAADESMHAHHVVEIALP